jgi:hypothetical integral membrane protein (TIGR02206 family)
MKRVHRIVIAAGFSVLLGMEIIMAVILCRPDGIRMHAPVPGISLPLSTTVAGDAWMRGGVSRIEVVVHGPGGATRTVPAERDTIRARGEPVSVLAGWHAAVTFDAPGGYVLSAVAVAASDGRTISTGERQVVAAAGEVSRQFVFLSLPHILALVAVLAACILVPLFARRSRNPAVRDRVALGICLVLYVHELIYQVYWFIIGAWTVGNSLMLHMCGLALMFLPFVYFLPDGRARQYCFEVLYFFGLGGAMQALFTPDIGMHGFPELKYFDYFLSHGTIVLGMVYAAAVYRLPLRLVSTVRIALVGTAACLVMFGVDRLFLLFPPYELGNYFVMGYPPPTGSIIDVFAAIFGPAPRYLAGLEIMGVAVLAVITAPYWIGWIRRRPARPS